MDSRTAAKGNAPDRPAAVASAAAAGVEQRLQEIRQHMPGVYAAIWAKAAELGGLSVDALRRMDPAAWPSASAQVFRLVRRGVGGQPGCFYAFERGRVVGTPFAGLDIERDVAAVMVQFECAHVCMWGAIAQESAHGPH